MKFHLWHSWTHWRVISDKDIQIYNTLIGKLGVKREIVQIRSCKVCNLHEYKITTI